jgi:hypothetical protein
VKAEDVNLNASLKITIRIKSDTKETALSFNDMTYIANIRRCSEYLDEVFRIAEESDHPDEVTLEEKDVNLAAEFLLVLASLGDGDSLPNLSYNLGFADLASKWIVGVFVTFFQNYIKSTLAELCDINRQPVVVTSDAVIGANKHIRLVPVGTSGSLYHCNTMVVERCVKPEEWRLKFPGSEYSFNAHDDSKSLRNCSGKWKDLQYAAGTTYEKYYCEKRHRSETSQFNVKIELTTQKQAEDFISIVTCIRAHEEYRRGTIFDTTTLSQIIVQHPHLRTKKILAASMSRDELIECLSMWHY